MIKCINCNNEISETSTVCPFCGSLVNQNAPAVDNMPTSIPDFDINSIPVEKPDFLDIQKDVETHSNQTPNDNNQKPSNNKKSSLLPMIIGLVIIVIAIGIAIYFVVKNKG